MATTLFSAYRWLTFGSLIICNSIICSIAAWNLSFFVVRGNSVAVDTYLIFTSALALVLFFPVILVDISRRNALLSRVWFELSWVLLFWIFGFSGAIASSTIMPSQLCIPAVMRQGNQACVSARVLIAFAWINTTILFVYGLLLAVLSWLHSSQNPNVWFTSVKDVPWLSSRQTLSSAPGTPVMKLYQGGAPSIIAPKPRRPPPIFVQRRSAISSKYEIDHYPSSEGVVEPVQKAPKVPLTKVTQQPLSLYPGHVVQNMTSALPSNAIPLGPSPPPLGDWPKRMPSNGYSTHQSRSKSRSKEQSTRAVVPDAPSRRPTESRSQPRQQRQEPVAASSLASSQPNESSHRSRPTGPRKKTSSFSSKPRPPPLDLSPERMRAVRQ